MQFGCTVGETQFTDTFPGFVNGLPPVVTDLRHFACGNPGDGAILPQFRPRPARGVAAAHFRQETEPDFFPRLRKSVYPGKARFVSLTSPILPCDLSDQCCFSTLSQQLDGALPGPGQQLDVFCLSIKEVSDTSLDIQRRTNNRKRRQSFRGELQESGTQTLRLQSIFHTFQLITKEPGINFTSRNKRSTTLVKRQRDTSNSRISYGCPCRNQDRASRNDRRSCPDPFLCDCTPCRVQLPRNRSQVDWRGPRDAAVPVFRIRGRCPSVDNPKQPTQRDPGPVHFFTFRSRS